MKDKNTYPRLERGPMIEVPSPRNGRPGYRWVDGWIVRFSESRTSTPVTLKEAREWLQAAKGNA